MEGCEMCGTESAGDEAARGDGVQSLLPGALTPDELREERRRVYRELGIVKMEREGRSVLVAGRRVKAWRVAGTLEFVEHARLVALAAEVFSRAE
jgi:hypothetical protein